MLCFVIISSVLFFYLLCVSLNERIMKHSGESERRLIFIGPYVNERNVLSSGGTLMGEK